MTKRILTAAVMLFLLSGGARAETIYGKTVFMDDVSVGSWKAISNLTASASWNTNGTYTSGTFVVAFRIGGTNRAGRIPMSDPVSLSWAGSGVSNAIRIGWKPYEGLSKVVLEKSSDGGASWGRVVLDPGSTNFVDTRASLWTSGSITGIALIPAPSYPWAVPTPETDPVWTADKPSYYPRSNPSNYITLVDVPDGETDPSWQADKPSYYPRSNPSNYITLAEVPAFPTVTNELTNSVWVLNPEGQVLMTTTNLKSGLNFSMGIPESTVLVRGRHTIDNSSAWSNNTRVVGFGREATRIDFVVPLIQWRGGSFQTNTFEHLTMTYSNDSSFYFHYTLSSSGTLKLRDTLFHCVKNSGSYGLQIPAGGGTLVEIYDSEIKENVAGWLMGPNSVIISRSIVPSGFVEYTTPLRQATNKWQRFDLPPDVSYSGHTQSVNSIYDAGDLAKSNNAAYYAYLSNMFQSVFWSKTNLFLKDGDYAPNLGMSLTLIPDSDTNVVIISGGTWADGAYTWSPGDGYYVDGTYSYLIQWNGTEWFIDNWGGGGFTSNPTMFPHTWDIYGSEVGPPPSGLYGSTYHTNTTQEVATRALMSLTNNPGLATVLGVSSYGGSNSMHGITDINNGTDDSPQLPYQRFGIDFNNGRLYRSVDWIVPELNEFERLNWKLGLLYNGQLDLGAGSTAAVSLNWISQQLLTMNTYEGWKRWTYNGIATGVDTNELMNWGATSNRFYPRNNPSNYITLAQVPADSDTLQTVTARGNSASHIKLDRLTVNQSVSQTNGYGSISLGAYSTAPAMWSFAGGYAGHATGDYSFVWGGIGSQKYGRGTASFNVWCYGGFYLDDVLFWKTNTFFLPVPAGNVTGAPWLTSSSSLNKNNITNFNDSLCVPSNIVVALGTALVTRAHGDTCYIVATNNTEIDFLTTDWQTNSIGRVSIDLIPAGHSISASTNITGFGSLTLTNVVNPLFFRKHYNSSTWEVRQ